VGGESLIPVQSYSSRPVADDLAARRAERPLADVVSHAATILITVMLPVQSVLRPDGSPGRNRVARWVADVPTGWRGVRPTGWLRLGPGTEETWGVDDYLASAILVRNAGAHRSAAALAAVAERRNLPFLDSEAGQVTTGFRTNGFSGSSSRRTGTGASTSGYGRCPERVSKPSSHSERARAVRNR